MDTFCFHLLEQDTLYFWKCHKLSMGRWGDHMAHANTVSTLSLIYTAIPKYFPSDTKIIFWLKPGTFRPCITDWWCRKMIFNMKKVSYAWLLFAFHLRMQVQNFIPSDTKISSVRHQNKCGSCMQKLSAKMHLDHISLLSDDEKLY